MYNLALTHFRTCFHLARRYCRKQWTYDRRYWLFVLANLVISNEYYEDVFLCAKCCMRMVPIQQHANRMSKEAGKSRGKWNHSVTNVFFLLFQRTYLFLVVMGLFLKKYEFYTVNIIHHSCQWPRFWAIFFSASTTSLNLISLAPTTNVGNTNRGQSHSRTATSFLSARPSTCTNSTKR